MRKIMFVVAAFSVMLSAGSVNAFTHDKLQKQLENTAKQLLEPQPKKSRPEASASPSVENAPAKGTVKSNNSCDAPYEPMGPKLFGDFYGGDNFKDVQCKLSAMKSKSPGLKIEASWGQQAGPTVCGRSKKCIIKIGKLGDFGDQLNNQYINLTDAPYELTAKTFVINNIKFDVEFEFGNGGTNKFFYGYPIYKLKHGMRVMKDSSNAVTMEVLQGMNFRSNDAQNVIRHNAKELFAKFDNAFKDHQKDGSGNEVEYYKGSKMVRLEMREGEILITYEFDISQAGSRGKEAMNLYYEAEQNKLNKNKKKDSGGL